MQWKIDQQTIQAATKYPLSLKRSSPAPQPNGHEFSVRKWDRYVIRPSAWPNPPLRSDPQQIIQQFQSRRYTQALTMVVSWGEMWRHPEAIWGTRHLGAIEQVLHDCAQHIMGSQSIEDSWRVLTGIGHGQLGWTAVITSKTLHFLCRSLGFQHDPPVAIDGAVIRQRVWPVFRDSIPMAHRPRSWGGNSFEAYSRYMTAMLTWANQRAWTTTEIEATIFDQFG
jgi:hypothetical protein